MSYNVKIRFKRTRSKDYKSETKDFESEEDFNNWLDIQYKDESYRKVLDWIKID